MEQIDDQERVYLVTLLISAFFDADEGDRLRIKRLIRKLEGVDTRLFVQRERAEA
jgi:hypothetical protein